MSRRSESARSPADDFPMATSEEPVPASSDLAGGVGESGGDSDADPDKPASRKRQRIRLSCLECRRRKLSCNRMRPCDRCLKSETPNRCKYELRGGQVVDATSDAFPAEYRRMDPASASLQERDDRIRRLEQEVALLRQEFQGGGGGGGGIKRRRSLDETPVSRTSTPLAGGVGGAPDCHDDTGSSPAERREAMPNMTLANAKGELRFVRMKEFRTRFLGPHSAAMALAELTELSPFVKETADELFGAVSRQQEAEIRARRRERDEAREQLEGGPDPELEKLLPTQEETNALVTLYLDVFEQLHRILHIPTFRRDYQRYWSPIEIRPSGARRASMTALILAILAVSSALYNTHSNVKFVGMLADNHRSAVTWVSAVDGWLGRQSQKHRRLVHFQISCLLYIGKRVNTIKKKRFWTGAGALIQDAISLGLHRSTRHMAGQMTAYNQEMRRRIWATVQELDMQASFDFGLPTAVSQLHYDVAAPSNLDDEQFDEDTADLPPSRRPASHYTFSSYQHLSRQSLPLRLELSRFLYGPPGQADYDDVIKYSQALDQEIASLPAWDGGSGGGARRAANPKRPILAYAMLHIQLRQYMLPLHGQYMKLAKQNSRYQYSEKRSYEAARDIIHLHQKLYDHGIQALNFLREDLVNNAIKMCSVTMLEPRGTTSMIMISAEETVSLVEKCIAMKEDRLFRSGNYEPWSFVFLYSALGLLEAHLEVKTAAEAKASSVERFRNLQVKFFKTHGHLKLSGNNTNNNGNNNYNNNSGGISRTSMGGPASMGMPNSLSSPHRRNAAPSLSPLATGGTLLPPPPLPPLTSAAMANGPLPAAPNVPNTMAPFQPRPPMQQVSLPPPGGLVTGPQGLLTPDFSHFTMDFAHSIGPEQFLGDFFQFNAEGFPFQQ